MLRLFLIILHVSIEMWLSWLKHTPDKRESTGSSPVISTINYSVYISIVTLSAKNYD